MVFRSLGPPVTSTSLLNCLFTGILVLVLLQMMIDYFNGCVRAYSIDISA
jgi:hypothetical protein